ncbi:MAG: hypothetical protein DYG93_11225 [Leptolyngbya sp. PLA2]|nr:hypothetical protein [Leptolyngbya sp.]MCE7972215.1 hypothetical protein [Leptolyngbya sp. PL-A2]MCQ3941206.1 hypothetical protein [cyanobacterium CYA1]
MAERVYAYTLDWATTIAAGANAQASKAFSQNGTFILESLRAAVYIPSASGSAVAFTPAPRDAVATRDSNTFMTLAAFRVELFTAGEPWFDAPVRLNLLVGDGRDPGYFTTRHTIPENVTVRGILYNDSGESVRAQLVFWGKRRYRA